MPSRDYANSIPPFLRLATVGSYIDLVLEDKITWAIDEDLPLILGQAWPNAS